MLLPTHCWNASVRPSAVQESTSPLPPALLVIGPPPGHVQTCLAPVARLNTSIAGPGPPPRPPRRATASLLPSRVSANPDIVARAGTAGMGSGVSGPGRPPAPRRRRKNLVAVASVNDPRAHRVTFHLFAARTKVRPSPAAAALNVP